MLKALQQLTPIKFKDGRIHLKKKSPLNAGLNEYRRIISNGKGASSEAIIQTFISPPFGIRKGILPLLIAIWDNALEGAVSHYCDQKFVTAVDGDHYDMLLKQPKICQIQYTDISEKKRFYISSLAKTLGKENGSS